MIYRRLKYSLFLIGISFSISLSALGQPIIYVNDTATGADNGTSWTDAYTFLQDALQAAQSGDEVWVSQGIYMPDQGTGIAAGDREASFEIPGGLSVYGGFSGSEFSRAERDWNANETILSGDLVGNDDELLSVDNPLRLDNSFHIVRLEHSTGPIVLDGFTIQDGMGIGSGSYGGGGIRVRSPSVYVFDFPFFRISNCRFTRNVASSGIVSISANPEEFEPTITIEDSIFEQNLGTGTSVIGGTTLIRNVLFTDNESNGHPVLSVGLASVYVSGSTIRNNRTTGSLGVVYVGGGRRR